MAGCDRDFPSAGSDLDAGTCTDQVRQSGASSTSANSSTRLSTEDAYQGSMPLASEAEMTGGQQLLLDLMPQESSGTHSSLPRLRRDAGSSRNMHVTRTSASQQSLPPQQEETGIFLASTIGSPPPGSVVQEIVNEKATHSESGIPVAQGISNETPPATVAHQLDNEHDEHEHSEGSDGFADHDFEYGGEQEDCKEAREKPENTEGRKEEGEDTARETRQAGDDGEENQGVASVRTTTQSVSCDSRGNLLITQDALPESSPAPGGLAPVPEQSTQDGNVQHTSTAASPQQLGCLEAKENGEKHERAQAPFSALIPEVSSTEMTSNTLVVGRGFPQPLPDTVPRTTATGEPNGQLGMQVAPGYVRRPSYVLGTAMRTGRRASRASSVQLSLPPVTESGPETESAGAASNENALQLLRAAADEVEPEDSGQPEEGESWEDYYARASRRQHSTPNLVSFRRKARQLSVELFEEGDSDDTSSSSRSSGSGGGDDSDVERQNAAAWHQSEEGKHRMAQLTKATVAVESPAAKMSKKYLKLFAPANSAHETYKVLAAMHRRMNGTGWPRRGGWDSYLVRRSRMELDEGRVYGIKSKEGRVEFLLMSSNNVCGRILPIIARLESLRCINLSDNHLSGPIPAELGSLLQLQNLQLQGNSLRDTIPALLGSLISLIRLSLGHNKLYGSLPDSLGNLIHLKYFSAEHNRLTGSIPSYLCHMTALETFNVSNNELGGAIPDKIGALGRLKKLDLANNQFSGDIPASLGNLLSLNWLLLDRNQLTGPVPASFGNLSELFLLNLSFNRLSGPLPAALVPLSRLTSVSLQGNLFVGPFQFPTPKPQEEFSHISGLAAIDFGFNEVEEPFPDMRGMHHLQILLLNNNRMYDRLAEGLAEACPNLFKLHLQNNRLSGEIPRNLGALTKLEVLDLSDNCFSGGLPPTMGSLQLLNTFSASNNELSGELPPFLGSLTSLTCLALDGNQFSGPMPRELGKLTLLKRLYLERNELVASIPKHLSKCTSLEALYLHDNKLWGQIPDSLRALRGLRYLYLHRNKLTGVVPEWLGELFRLRGLILAENRLRGHIPWQLGHLHKLQDLYLNDNNLEGSIPDRMVANCECLRRLYLGGNRLTGTVPRHLSHLRDLQEINIERNNLHGELPIPLFLKKSLGPNARGLKWDGNPRIVDSRHNFTSVLGCTRRAGPEKKASSFEPQDRQHPGRQSGSTYRPTSVILVAPDRRISYRARPSTSRGFGEMPTGLRLEPERARADGNTQREGEHSEDLVGPTSGIEAVEEVRDELGDDRGSVARPWANSEDVCYFLFKVIAGNALVWIDFVIAVRLYAIGCIWGCVLVMIWKAIAGFEGITATRRLGYGNCWLPMSALGLALTWQARICFHHSCESDLFQALQQVEWRWHAMIQLATQLAAALSWWGRGQVGYWYLLASLGLKALVVGVVSMQRLDDKRLTRHRERRLDSTIPGSAPSVFIDRFLPWLRDSAWPRLIFVGFHAAEACERTIPLASLTAALGDWAFIAPLALTPGMFARYITRRARNSRSRGGSGGVACFVWSALKISLALDSAYGAGTRGHVVATISTTLEAVLFEALASSMPREYPDHLHHGLSFSIFAVLVFTWAVVVLEMAVPVGREHEREREREPHRLLPPPPSPRLPLLGRFAPSKAAFSRPGSASSKTPPRTIYVQPTASTLVTTDDADRSGGCSKSERIADGRQEPIDGRGGKRAAMVVPIER